MTRVHAAYRALAQLDAAERAAFKALFDAAFAQCKPPLTVSFHEGSAGE